jgi:hypothetical protein
MRTGDVPMIQSRAVQSQADAHRRDLLASASTRRPVLATPVEGLGREGRAPGHALSAGRATRRTVAPRIGSWLIGLGTKMGGASIRTS